MTRVAADLAVFETHRASLIALAYRMLGDLGRAEDLVQEAWVRWHGRQTEASSPRAFLITIVTRLCLNELDSARARHEDTGLDRLPEPVDLEAGGLARIVALEQISMAFLVALQRLTPTERAVLLLHDVFDFEHREIAELVGKNAPACRKLLERARENIAAEKRLLSTSHEAHERLLGAFMRAATAGDTSGLARLLAEDAVLVTDGGQAGRSVGGIRNLTQPLFGAEDIAAFVATVTLRSVGVLVPELHELNGQPALVLYAGDQPFAAILLGVADGLIHRVFFHGDPARLRHLGLRSRGALAPEQ